MNIQPMGIQTPTNNYKNNRKNVHFKKNFKLVHNGKPVLNSKIAKNACEMLQAMDSKHIDKYGWHTLPFNLDRFDTPKEIRILTGDDALELRNVNQLSDIKTEELLAKPTDKVIEYLDLCRDFVEKYMNKSQIF